MASGLRAQQIYDPVRRLSPTGLAAFVAAGDGSAHPPWQQARDIAMRETPAQAPLPLPPPPQ